MNAQTRGQRREGRRTAAPAAPRRTCRVWGSGLYGSARKLGPTCCPVARNEQMRQLGLARRKARDPKPTVEHHSGGITLEQYQTEILPALAEVPLPEIERATGLSNSTCSRLRRGLQIPNPKHWQMLAIVANLGPAAHPATGRYATNNGEVPVQAGLDQG